MLMPQENLGRKRWRARDDVQTRRMGGMLPVAGQNCDGRMRIILLAQALALCE